MTQRIVVLLTVVFLLTSGVMAQPLAKVDTSDNDNLMTRFAQGLIFEKDLRSLAKFVEAGSLVITGSKEVSLYDVVTGNDRSTIITEDPNTRRLLRMSFKSDQTEDSAVLHLTTADSTGHDVHNHVLFLMKNKERRWTISVWRPAN
jgi:hypothetical protein